MVNRINRVMTHGHGLPLQLNIEDNSSTVSSTPPFSSSNTETTRISPLTKPIREISSCSNLKQYAQVHTFKGKKTEEEKNAFFSRLSSSDQASLFGKLSIDEQNMLATSLKEKVFESMPPQLRAAFVKENPSLSCFIRDEQHAKLNDPHNFQNADLKKIPVHYVNINTRGYGIPTHGFIVAGNPGKGRKSGAALYSVGGDPKRGSVNIDQAFMEKVNERALLTGEYKFNSSIRSAVKELQGQSYSSREDFHRAYEEVRTKQGVDVEYIAAEIKKLQHLVPKTQMEMWLKQPNGYQAQYANAGEGDIRAFENSHRSNWLTGEAKFFGKKKRGFENTYLMEINNVRSIDLLEAKQQFLLQQNYIDERHGRIGTGIPHPDVQPIASPKERKRLASITPTFQRFPPFRSETVGNCNTGAASLAQRAMDKFPNEQQRGRVKNANIAGLGVNHRLRMWDPLAIRPDAIPMPLNIGLQDLVNRVKNDGLVVPIDAHTLLATATSLDMQYTLKVYQEFDNLLNDEPGAKNPPRLHLYNIVKKMLGGPKEPKKFWWEQPYYDYDSEYFGKNENIPKQFLNDITEPNAQKLSDAALTCDSLALKLKPFFVEQAAKLIDKRSDERSEAFDELNNAIWYGDYPGKREDVLKNPQKFIAESYNAISLALGCVGTHISILKRQMAKRPELQTDENQQQIQMTDAIYEATCNVMRRGSTLRYI